MIDLIPVNNDSIKFYKNFERNYNVSLKHYMSRIYPHNYEHYEKLTQQKQLFWNYIVFNNNYVGSAWLEKETSNDITATLGIFICDNFFQGKGIGEYVINHIIINGGAILGVKKVQLRVRESNERAIYCYKKCDFKETNRFINNNEIKVIEMEKQLDAILWI